MLFYEGHVARNPFELADRPKVPEQAATDGLSKQGVPVYSGGNGELR
jgi:hypothetical protein